MLKVLFVCMGNICRSPTAEGLFQQYITTQGLAHQFKLDSAGTVSEHVGEAPDSRAIRVAEQHGLNIRHLRARLITPQDFVTFDYILTMDKHNIRTLTALCPPLYQHKICLFLGDKEVPDPYSGDMSDFEHAFALMNTALPALLQMLMQAKHG
jgi:protein-tyrosine phosphatase